MQVSEKSTEGLTLDEAQELRDMLSELFEPLYEGRTGSIPEKEAINKAIIIVRSMDETFRRIIQGKH
jgi:hypothetical protein